MKAQRVQFPADGGKTEAFLALPAGGGPGVIVIQEWWGLVPHIEDVCRRFAALGFVALAPDLYHGDMTRSPDDAGKLMMALDIARAETDLRGAVQYLLNHETATSDRVGVVGFCMGGQLALYAASKNPDIGAAVDFYGIHPNVTPDYAALRAPVLGFFGEEDPMVTPAVARGLEAALRAAGKTVEIHVYPGAAHAFFNDTRTEVYHETAAQDAWSRTIDFFRRNLGA